MRARDTLRQASAKVTTDIDGSKGEVSVWRASNQRIHRRAHVRSGCEEDRADLLQRAVRLLLPDIGRTFVRLDRRVPRLHTLPPTAKAGLLLRVLRPDHQHPADTRLGRTLSEPFLQSGGPLGVEDQDLALCESDAVR